MSDEEHTDDQEDQQPQERQPTQEITCQGSVALPPMSARA